VISTFLTLTLAFGSPDDFGAPATLGGGNEVRFTGSPTARWTCAVCHDAEPRGPNPLELTAMGRDLPAKGYEPGQTYELELISDSTTEGRSAFALELANRTGARSGVLELAPPLMGSAADPYLCAGRDPVVISTSGVAQSYSCAVKKWRMSWTAPAADEGSVTLYLSVVDSNADSRTTGDLTHSMVLGIPSPSTVSARASGCSSVPGGLVLLGVLLLLWRRRSSVVLVAVLLATTADAAAKKKKVPPKKEPVLSQPIAPPAPAPALEVPAPLASAVLPSPQPSPPLGERETRVVAAIPDTSMLPGALEVDARLGFGLSSLALSSLSYATPFRASFGFPSVSLGVTLYPTRLLRSTVAPGLHLQGSYAVGFVLQTLPLGGALVMPSEGRVALGYTARFGPLELSPRALYRVVIGGVERNALFDDGYFQSVGGELGLGLVLGAFSLRVTPRAGALVDVGTQMVRGYGASRGGLMYGGSAGAGWRIGSGFQLSATYQLTFMKAGFAGRGVRDFEALTLDETVHAGYVVLAFER
jgi:hypothetical protein